jgi:hypothetical protein
MEGEIMAQSSILREHLTDHAEGYIDPKVHLLSGSYENIREILEENLSNLSIDVFALVARLSNYGAHRVSGSVIMTDASMAHLDPQVLLNSLTELAGLAIIDVRLGDGDILSAPAAYRFFETTPVGPGEWNVGVGGMTEDERKWV